MRTHWSGRLAFILAASGSAVGLGNIWKFPYITGENGGGAFVLVYLITIALVGLPIFIAEVFVGQKAQTNAVTAFAVVEEKPRSFYSIVGVFGILGAFLILSFYSVVGGWILSFGFKAVTGGFTGLDSDSIGGLLGKLLGDWQLLLFWHSIFMVLTAAIVVGGIKKGIERWAKILMPSFFALLLILLVFSFTLDGFGQAFSFLFSPDFSKLTPRSILEAVGHSFFTLSLGMGAMITYGSYLSRSERLIPTALTITFLDTIIALIAGLIIFSVVFTFGQQPNSGPGLLFSTMPTLFAQIPGGTFFLVAFFALVGFAALTSAISLLEVVVAYFVDRRGFSQKSATILFAAIIWGFGVLCALSFNVFTGVIDFFDLFDKITTHLILPFGGILISLFFGWVVKREDVEGIFGGPGLACQMFTWVTRIVAPLGVTIVMIFGLIDWLG